MPATIVLGCCVGIGFLSCISGVLHGTEPVPEGSHYICKRDFAISCVQASKDARAPSCVMQASKDAM